MVRCEYSTFADIMLTRDQLVLGIRDDAIRKRLLSAIKLIFEKAIQTTTLIEQVSTEAATLRHMISYYFVVLNVRTKLLSIIHDTIRKLFLQDINHVNVSTDFTRRINVGLQIFACNQKGHLAII